ncbi:MAG TPA: phenylalanine--tRNA ligase subunit alpha, partial [Fredinandcohnia sp.]|nr:phenylalanine--tRNA ligase subunit alpha [Fredinandcohnia sp.]
MEISSEHKARIQEAKEQVLARIEEAEDEDALERARVFGLGKSGLVSELRRTIGSLPPEMRKPFGEAVNEAIAAVEEALARRAQQLAEARLRAELEGPRLDLTLPGRARPLGRRHPISHTMEDLLALLGRMGFEVVEGPEVELDYYNFEALNFPKDHPARDMQDTFFVDEGSIRGGTLPEGSVLLRTHTSPVQVRAMLERKPPVRIVVPGRVFRHDSD